MHLVASLGTHLLDVEITACRQGARRSACEHSNAQTTKASPRPALRTRLGKPGRYAGPLLAPVGTLAFRVGRRVRISFAPAASHQRTRSPKNSSQLRAVEPSNADA